MTRRGRRAPARPFLVPDVPASVETATQVKSHWFTLKPGLSLLFDYNVVGLDRFATGERGNSDILIMRLQYVY